MKHDYYNQSEVLSKTKQTKLSLLKNIIDEKFPRPIKFGSYVNGNIVQNNLWPKDKIDTLVEKEGDRKTKWRPSRRNEYMTCNQKGENIRWYDIEKEFKPIIYRINRISPFKVVRL